MLYPRVVFQHTLYTFKINRAYVNIRAGVEVCVMCKVQTITIFVFNKNSVLRWLKNLCFRRTIRYFSFGSKVVGNRTGIIFNNQMNNFSSTNKTTGSPSNGIVPRKRPMSSMSPTIVLDKDDNLVLVIGSSGSKRIISGTLQVRNCLIMSSVDKASADCRINKHQSIHPSIYLFIYRLIN